MSEKKDKIITKKIGNYIVTANGTRMIVPAQEKNDKGEYVNVPFNLTGNYVLYVNLFDENFREKYEIPDWKKGTLSVRLNEDGSIYNSPPYEGKGKKSKQADDGDDVNF